MLNIQRKQFLRKGLEGLLLGQFLPSFSQKFLFSLREGDEFFNRRCQTGGSAIKHKTRVGHIGIIAACRKRQSPACRRFKYRLIIEAAWRAVDEQLMCAIYGGRLPIWNA